MLAILGLPRVVVHDLHLFDLESIPYKILAIVPFVTWGLYALFGKSKRPIYDFMLLGLIFGLMLAVTHQLTWDASWGSNPPQLHGNLEDTFDPMIESVLLRSAAFISSILSGMMFGGVCALVALASFNAAWSQKHKPRPSKR